MYMIPRSLNWVARQIANSGMALFMELGDFAIHLRGGRVCFIINSIGLFIQNSEAENKVNTATRSLMI